MKDKIVELLETNDPKNLKIAYRMIVATDFSFRELIALCEEYMKGDLQNREMWRATPIVLSLWATDLVIIPETMYDTAYHVDWETIVQTVNPQRIKTEDLPSSYFDLYDSEIEALGISTPEQNGQG
jgi:hypothetical protein